MPTQRLSMRRIKQLLTMRFGAGASTREIARELGVAPSTVRDYLVSQSVPDGNVTAAGYGKAHPVADNSTNAGRAQNRRVELVVSGAAIGIDQSAPGDSSQTSPSGGGAGGQTGQSAAAQQ